jgi:ankyrin repeat protein
VLGAGKFDLVMAVIHCDADEVRRAHEAGVDLTSVATPGGSLFGWAAEWGRTEILACLLAQGIEPEPKALSKAASRGHAKTVRLLLDHGMNPDLPSEWPPLCAAADCGSPECVRVLLQAGARVDVQMGQGRAAGAGRPPGSLP